MIPEQTLWDEFCFRIDESNLRIRADQIRSRLQIFPVIVVSQVLVALAFVGLMWEQVAQRGLLWWLSISVFVHCLELITWWRFRTATGTVEECLAWRDRFIVGAVVVGLVWGGAFMLFYPQELAYQAFVICIAIGLSAGAVTVNPMFPPSLYLYVPLLIVPTGIATLLQGDVLHWILAGMLLVFIFIALNSGRQLAKTFFVSLWQRYENLSLVEQLTREKTRAETASREKSRFLATASHDLRQPLQALVLFSEALQETAKEESLQHLSAQIGKSVRALVEMFDELLDVSRLEAGVVEPRWQSFELQAMFDRLYAEFAPLAQTKKLVFVVPMGAWVAYSDPYLLERILRNLISNAIRYTDTGGVQVGCEPSEHGLRLSVRDSGIGIGKEAIPHIFDEYYQADNPHRDRRKGLGLGLAIVRRVEGLLGYKLDIASEPGKGSTFSFVVAEGDAADLAQPFVITHSRHNLAGVKVALVEDDADIREMVKGLMEDWGCKVIAGEYADDVMRKLDVAGMRPDILVSDYRLPHGFTAIDVIKRVRDLWGYDIPVLVLTGDTASETLHAIHASGAVLLHKPIAPARLRSMMYFAMHGETVGQ